MNGQHIHLVLDIDVHYLMSSAILLFLDFTQSTPRLEKLAVIYFPVDEEMQDEYEALISQIFLAVLHNPSIKELTANGSLVGRIHE